jgi:hypothetical protein
VIVVNKIVIGIVLSLATTNLVAQSRAVKPHISVTFAIDGETVPCDNLKIELRVDHRLIPVKMIDSGFIVPNLFKKLYDSPRSHEKNNIDIHIECGEYSFDLPGEYPVRLLPGKWEMAIRYPTTWLTDSKENVLIEQGVWLSYINWNSDGCEPCTVTMISHSDLPVATVNRLHKEQSNSEGTRARDIAYALAVFNFEYDRNRRYLLNLMNTCLSKPKDTTSNDDDDVCDSRLGDYLNNLYWRGDNELLKVLLNLADSQAEAADDNSYFYGDLLDRRTTEFIRGLESLPTENQQIVCKLAGKDDLSIDSPKEERVAKQLTLIGGEVAMRCLQEIEKTENWWQKGK